MTDHLARRDSNLLLDRLRQSTSLSDADLQELDGLCEGHRRIEARVALLSPGRQPERLYVLLNGWAVRYTVLLNGGRQITALLLPGDVCNLDRLYVGTADYAVNTVTACLVATINCSALRHLVIERPAISQALGWLGVAEAGLMAERITSVGRRSARERVAHLLCELYDRLRAVGHARDHRYTLPLTQGDIGDALGLSSVHVNRTIQALLADGLIRMEARSVLIRDWDRLREVAGFDPGHLRMNAAAVQEGGHDAR